MWNKFKNSFFDQVIQPIYDFWHWLFIRLGFTKPALIKKDWPYADVREKNKLTYRWTRVELESRMSRKFREFDEVQALKGQLGCFRMYKLWDKFFA